MRTAVRDLQCRSWWTHWSGSISSRPHVATEAWESYGFYRGNHPLLWPNYSGWWNIIIYPDLWCTHFDKKSSWKTHEDSTDVLIVPRVIVHYRGPRSLPWPKWPKRWCPCLMVESVGFPVLGRPSRRSQNWGCIRFWLESNMPLLRPDD